MASISSTSGKLEQASRARDLDSLRHALPGILPSLLLCDFGNLEREIGLLERSGVPALHLDVMDGRFVPNFSYGLTIVEAIRRLTRLPLDVHLMMVEPGRYVERFVQAGADSVTIHVEAAGPDTASTLSAIRQAGARAGLALNPSTPLTTIEPYLEQCDLALVMSVEAGFGGQKFHPESLNRLATLRDRANRRFLIEVDGGVNDATIADCARAGAELFVVGSAIFNHTDYRQRVERLASLAAGRE